MTFEDLLRNGQNTEVYRMKSPIESWNDVLVVIHRTPEDEIVGAIQFHSNDHLPKQSPLPASTKWGKGRNVPICRAVTHADYEFVEVRAL